MASKKFKKESKVIAKNILSKIRKILDNPKFELIKSSKWGTSYRLKNSRRHIPKAKEVTIEVAELGKGKRASIIVDFPYKRYWETETSLSNTNKVVKDFKKLYKKFNKIEKGVVKKKLSEVIR